MIGEIIDLSLFDASLIVAIDNDIKMRYTLV